MTKLKDKFSIWSLYYRQEIVWCIIGFLTGFTLGVLCL